MIPGWNRDITPWMERFAPRIPPGGTYLEVGVFLGASLAVMGTLRPDIQLIAVDPWLCEQARGWTGPGEYTQLVGGDLFGSFLRNMLEHAPGVLARTRVIRGTALTVSLHAEVDLLFIDGAHDEQSVLEDLRVFAPLVRPGGIVAGHDYHPDYPGVALAVDAYLGRKPETMESVWWFER